MAAEPLPDLGFRMLEPDLKGFLFWADSWFCGTLVTPHPVRFSVPGFVSPQLRSRPVAFDQASHGGL